ncbi:hypothetical protein GEV33_004573 [Tenebrio molitor]|uniref:Ig-like domain-containing protein n=1 Tax=Tenebrio molitor TaxID=7067 RepID=A0A8J6HQ07_TENMO|nr:hypothetical protein GEV33_004573 [Tenebrio molitor]
MKYHHLVLLCIHTFVLIFCVNPAFSDSDAKGECRAPIDAAPSLSQRGPVLSVDSSVCVFLGYFRGPLDRPGIADGFGPSERLCGIIERTERNPPPAFDRNKTGGVSYRRRCIINGGYLLTDARCFARIIGGKLSSTRRWWRFLSKGPATIAEGNRPECDFDRCERNSECRSDGFDIMQRICGNRTRLQHPTADGRAEKRGRGVWSVEVLGRLLRSQGTYPGQVSTEQSSENFSGVLYAKQGLHGRKKKEFIPDPVRSRSAATRNKQNAAAFVRFVRKTVEAAFDFHPNPAPEVAFAVPDVPPISREEFFFVGAPLPSAFASIENVSRWGGAIDPTSSTPPPFDNANLIMFPARLVKNMAKGDKLVTEIEELKGRIEVSTKSDNTSTLVLKEAKDSDAGNYTCSLYDGDSKMASDTIRVAATTTGKWGLRVNKNVNVVEGEKLTLKCEVKGDLKLDWLYKNITSGENYTELVERDRITIKNYETDDDEKITIENGQVDIEDAKMMDRGIYLCRGIANDGEMYNASSTVRVKDKYAALWPFLGICAEVLVLCAIIVVYEKKRNKTELEESDTDQSPDQKNTPDHGKESNLRHRQ